MSDIQELRELESWQICAELRQLVQIKSELKAQNLGLSEVDILRYSKNINIKSK